MIFYFMHPKFAIGYSNQWNNTKYVCAAWYKNYIKSKKMIQKFKNIQIKKNQVFTLSTQFFCWLFLCFLLSNNCLSINFISVFD